MLLIRWVTGLILLSLFFTPLKTTAKEPALWTQNSAGFNAGLTIAIGNPVNRLGVFCAGYYVSDRLQLNTTLHLFRNFKSFGAPGSHWEMQLSLGSVFGFGPSTLNLNRFTSPLGNQTTYANTVGYAYTWYRDNHQTSQGTGRIGVQFDAFQFIHENDILAGKGRDRFRTGAISVTYLHNDFRYGLVYAGWTGDPKTKSTKRIENSDYPAKWGYKNLSASTHGKYSHGLLSFQAEHYIDYGQTARANVGVDAEQVRHALQNKLMHESITHGAHYPMLQKSGEPYLFKEDQAVRPLRFYYQLQANAPTFY
jgi:hypothetical protein